MKESIRLLHPENNSVSGPLQAHQHPGRQERAEARAQSAPAEKEGIRWDKLEKFDGDRSFPRPLDFAWQDFLIPRAESYSLLVSPDSDFSDLHIDVNLKGRYFRAHNLFIGTRYFWKVIAETRDGRSFSSPVHCFRTNSSPPRWIKVPGITNVRDMGGWAAGGHGAIRQGMVYRSSEMNSHVTIEKEGVKVLIDELKIRTDLDLRGSTEETRPVLDESAVKWINVPVRPYGSIIEEEGLASSRKIFRIFSEKSSYPVIFHCWGGADRGGTVAFLLHALLGMQLSDLIMDYELTSLSIWGDRTHESEYFRALRGALIPFSRDGNDITGQVENYLKHAGVSEEEILSIRRILIDGNP